jgi:hypothetical protein
MLYDWFESSSKEVNKLFKFTPDLDDLPETSLEYLENDESLQVLDKNGKLKVAGWMKRDRNLSFDRSLLFYNTTNFWLRELTKVKHLT